MKAIDFPVAKLYIFEVRRALNSGLHLACISTCGALIELMVREYAPKKYRRQKISRIIDTLLKRGLIEQRQYDALDKIRRVRNKYVHLNLGKNYEEICESGLSIIENGIVTMLKDYIDQAEEPETALVKIHKVLSVKDANNVIKLTEEFLDSIDIRN